MSWKIEMPLIIRTLINDNCDKPSYSDERLHQVIVVAAKYVKLDVILDNEYTLNMISSDITPDPTVLNDDVFIGLTCLKACCIIDQSSVRTKAALEGIRASLGPASLNVSGSLQGLKMMLEMGPCASYRNLVDYWDIQQASIVRAVLSPFVGNNFDPTSLTYPGDARRDLYS